MRAVSWPALSFELVEHLLGTEHRERLATPRSFPVNRVNVEIFWSFVDRTGPHCWPWQGPRLAGIYGHIPARDTVVYAHRFALEIDGGPLPEGICALHGCDNPPCVRVGQGHLFRGTQKDNRLDSISKGRAKSWGKPVRLVEIGGESHPIADWARINGVRIGTVYSRLRLGWSVADAVSIPALATGENRKAS